MVKVKKRKKPTAASLRRKALAAWSVSVRQRDARCIVCNATEHLNAHHLLPKERYHEYQYELSNGVTLCPSCHKFGKLSAHRNGIWFSEWMKANKQDQYNWVLMKLSLSNKSQNM